MPYLIIAVAVLVLSLMGLGRYRRLPPERRRIVLWRYGPVALFVILILLAATGRMHWLGAALGALVLFLKGAVSLGLQLYTLWLARRQHQQGSGNNPSPGAPDNIQEAMHMLGLKGDIHKGEITREQVIDTHRKLMQKLHPDRGGNDYLAAKINDAKELLLKYLS